MVGVTPKIVSIAIALAAIAWLVLLIGLLYAKFLVVDLPPNVVISFSNKGLTRLFVELSSLTVGSVGLLLVLVAFVRVAGNRALGLAALGNASICAVCVALLI